MRSNGLEAAGYVAVVDVHPVLADLLLDVFATEGVAAYAAPVVREHRLALRPDAPMGPTERVWVDRRETVRAREILRARMPALRAELEGSSGRDPAPRRSLDHYAVRDGSPTRDGSDQPDGPNRSPEPGVPDLVDDDLWAEIVASIRGYSVTDESDVSPAPGRRLWPELEDDYDSRDAPADPAGQIAGTAQQEVEPYEPGPHKAEPDEPEPQRGGGWDTDSEDWERPQPRRGMSSAPREDADHFVPPPPPPLPEVDRTLRLAWGGVIGGPLLFVLALVFQWELSSFAQLVGVAALVGGFITLVTRMRDDDDPQDPDHGAVL